MIVLSWIIFVLGVLLGVLEFINMLTNSHGGKRLMSFLFVLFYVLTTLITTHVIFGGY